MEYFGLTDKGRVRPTNQDIFQIEAREDNRTALLVVCDGMGGANAGNVASRFAAQSFIESAGDALSGTLDETARQNLLTQALKQANETVFSLAGRQPEFRGMGTTLVAALIQGDCATVINVGDSRAYHITPLTISVLYELINTRMLTHRPTIYTTNIIDQNIFVARYTEKVASRMLGGCKMFKFFGEDQRLK